MGRRILIAILISLLSTGAFAKSLSIQVVQNNPTVTDDTVFAVTDWVEQTIFGFFYDAGHIVTTNPVAMYKNDDAENKKSLTAALKETFLGGMEVLIRVQLNYRELSENPNLMVLDYVKSSNWVCYDARSGKVISKGDGKLPKVTIENNNENGITKFAANMAGDISKGLLSQGKKF